MSASHGVPTCDVGCGRSTGAVAYLFPSPNGSVTKCGRCALVHPPMVRSALRTAVAVGTILTVINHGVAIASGHLGVGLAAEVALTYLVPYAVSTYAALGVSRVRRGRPG